jgi:adenylate kinase
MNLLAFGPNGSGKGTQGAIAQKKYHFDHIESGAIFREHIKGGTELGKKAKEYIDRGDLVPDDITIPMVLETLGKSKEKGWLLDGFPRSLAQAEALDKALQESGMKLDYVIEIVLDRQIAKDRIMGRRLCVNDNNHPNHIAFDAIKPVEKDGKLVCRVCGGDLNTRADDQDEEAINKRHGIYYDDNTGTMAAVNYFKSLSGPKVISVDGSPSIDEVSEKIMSQID